MCIRDGPILSLLKVYGSWVIVHINGNFIYPGKGMEYQHILGSEIQFGFIQNVVVFQTYIDVYKRQV